MLRNRTGNPSSFQKPTQPVSTSTSQSVLKLVSQSRNSGRLNLSNQNLDIIPEALFTRPTAKADGNWWEEVELTRLVIADNEIGQLDARIGELGALTLIDAHNNKLTALPDLSNLLNLTVLHLASNNLTDIPLSLFSLPLAEVHLSGNKLSTFSIPSSSPTAQSLTILDISSNSLAEFPFQSLMPRLTKLVLKSNTLAGPLALPVSARPFFPILNHLDISHNRLSSLTTLPFHAPNLILLNASQNLLAQLFSPSSSQETRINLPGLLQLDVRVNRLATLTTPSCVINVPLLKELLLQSNKLTTVSGSGVLESALNSIETLDVRDNNLEAIPQEVVDMTGLKRLFVEGNAIRNPRRAILEKGTAAIVQWMKERVVA
ncbi:UNVERIFIED_CONTAM: Leucine-rich repeat-containing protein 40 [Siphonaria sp. JEL0065]|nr:Leucine-rich repeat-containing protein 40 [Siphonaria sp. JEL0065]